ncbi:MAG: hypothetical protein ACOYNP_18125, partial [Gemmataceae bacterium]
MVVGVVPVRFSTLGAPAKAPDNVTELVVPLKVKVRLTPPVLNPPEKVKFPTPAPLPLMSKAALPLTVAGPLKVKPYEVSVVKLLPGETVVVWLPRVSAPL